MIDKINFPVIRFDKHSFGVIENENKLITTTSAGLKNGLHNNIMLVDSEGQVFSIVGAKKLHGVGRFWEYNVFLNQRIKVELEFKTRIESMTLSDIKERLLKVLNKEKYYWEAGGNFKELIDFINNSQTIEDLIEQLRGTINKEYEV